MNDAAATAVADPEREPVPLAHHFDDPEQQHDSRDARHVGVPGDGGDVLRGRADGLHRLPDPLPGRVRRGEPPRAEPLDRRRQHPRPARQQPGRGPGGPRLADPRQAGHGGLPAADDPPGRLVPGDQGLRVFARIPREPLPGARLLLRASRGRPRRPQGRALLLPLLLHDRRCMRCT